MFRTASRYKSVRRASLLLLALTTASGAALADTNLVVDGSFEAISVDTGSWVFLAGTGLPGWTVQPGGGGDVEVRNNAVGKAQDGLNFVELDSQTQNSGIGQVLATTAGQHYVLSFWYSNRTGTAVESNGLSYTLDGVNWVAAPALAYNGTGDNVWSRYSVDFWATGASTSIGFFATGTSDTYGSSLDNVQVTAVPEPGNAALLLAGLGLVGGLARRRARYLRG